MDNPTVNDSIFEFKDKMGEFKLNFDSISHYRLVIEPKLDCDNCSEITYDDSGNAVIIFKGQIQSKELTDDGKSVWVRSIEVSGSDIQEVFQELASAYKLFIYD